jgi:hypothetical protein
MAARVATSRRERCAELDELEHDELGGRRERCAAVEHDDGGDRFMALGNLMAICKSTSSTFL